MAKKKKISLGTIGATLGSHISGGNLTKQEAICIAEERSANELREILSTAYEDYNNSEVKISAMFAHYRGIQVLSQKKTAVYSNWKLPGVNVSDENLQSFHEVLLLCYEA